MDALVDKLNAAWLASRRSNDEFIQLTATPPELHLHEEYLAQRAGVTLPAGLLAIAKALLGEAAFDEHLSDLKALAIEPAAQSARNPNGLFLHRVCEIIQRRDALPHSRPISATARKASR